MTQVIANSTLQCVYDLTVSHMDYMVLHHLKVEIPFCTQVLLTNISVHSPFLKQTKYVLLAHRKGGEVTVMSKVLVDFKVV